MYEYPEETVEELIRIYYHPVFTGVHPVANLAPLPSPEDFDRLCDSIMERGLGTCLKRDPDTRQLLDGRARLLACYVTGLDPRVEDVSPASPTGYSMEMNLARRHLTASQRAAVAASALELYEKEAKERQRAAIARGNVSRHEPPIVENSPQLAIARGNVSRHESPVEANLPQLATGAPRVRQRAAGKVHGAGQKLVVNPPQAIEEGAQPRRRSSGQKLEVNLPQAIEEARSPGPRQSRPTQAHKATSSRIWYD